MYLRLNFVSLCILIFLGIAHTAEDKKQSNSVWSPSTATTRDTEDLYIDDEAIEGSGHREIKDDLESSGSGSGPDDEDGEDYGSGKLFPVGLGGPSYKPPPTKSPEPPIPTYDKEPVLTQTKKPTDNTNIISKPDLNGDNNNGDDNNRAGNDVYILNAKPEDRPTSFFAQPGILAAVIGGAVVGLLCAILVVMFIVYRMRKKDEGSYALEEPKRSPTANSYTKNSNREFYA